MAKISKLQNIIETGKELFSKGLFKEALDKFTEGLIINRKDPELLFELGKA